MPSIKLDKADKMFSRYVRLRDKMCVRCGRKGEGKEGINGLQCSHFFGRSKESVRFDPENVNCLCYGCHRYWGSTDHESYREFKIKQLGKKGFENLKKRAYKLVKKDRDLAHEKAKELVRTLKEEC